MLNALGQFDGELPMPGMRRGTAHWQGVDWPIAWLPQVTAYVRDAHRSGLCEAQWLTTWGSGANAGLASLLGLPELVVAGEPPARGPLGAGSSHGDATGLAGGGTPKSRWWKYDVVTALVEADPARPLVWTDDDLFRHSWAADWVDSHAARALCLAPKAWTGLDAKDLASIHAFLTAPATIPG